MLKLYHASSSVCSQKVRVGLAEIGLDYESVMLDLQKGDQFDPAYLKLNHNAVVPTLVDDGLVVLESSLILEYLDREYNASGLMPADRANQAAARYWLLRALAIHSAINTMTFSTVNRARILAEKTPAEISQMLEKMPDVMARMKRKDLFDNGLRSAHVAQAFACLRRTFSDMSTALDSGDWVSGPAFGISDIALVAYIDRLERLGFAGLWSMEYPKVGDWLASMRARPSYQTAIGALIPAAAAASMKSSGLELWADVKKAWEAV